MIPYCKLDLKKHFLTSRYTLPIKERRKHSSKEDISTLKHSKEKEGKK